MLSDRHKKIVHYYMMNGFQQRDACVRAGLSKNSPSDIFSRADVKEEIKLRLKKAKRRLIWIEIGY